MWFYTFFFLNIKLISEPLSTLPYQKSSPKFLSHAQLCVELSYNMGWTMHTNANPDAPLSDKGGQIGSPQARCITCKLHHKGGKRHETSHGGNITWQIWHLWSTVKYKYTYCIYFMNWSSIQMQCFLSGLHWFSYTYLHDESGSKHFF